MTFQTMLAPVAEDMRRVDELIAARLESDVALVRKVAEYLVAAGGKRLLGAAAPRLRRARLPRRSAPQRRGGDRVHPHGDAAAR